MKEIFQSISELLEKSDNIPVLIHGIGLTLLTIFIPLSIAIFDKEKEFLELDKRVILDSIIKAKWFLLYIALIFIPPLFWDIYPNLCIILIILSFFGIGFIGKSLVNSYRWIRGDKFGPRFSHLQKLKSKKEIDIIWRSVWRTKGINFQNEKNFSEIFSSQTETLLTKEKEEYLEIAQRLLGDFQYFIENRNIFSTIENIFPKLLDWHYKMWNKVQGYRHKGASTWLYYDRILTILNSAIRKIENMLFKNEGLQEFLDYFKKHIENNKDKKEYLNSIFGIFYPEFFNNIADYKKEERIWEGDFPMEWKITKKNLQDKENLISRISLEKYLNWSIRRIQSPKKEFDKNLEEVTKNMFPEVDPILWSRVLIFRFSPYNPENRVKSVIECPWNFGYFGRVKVYWESSNYQDTDLESQCKTELENTFELAYLLFRNEFSKQNLKKYIRELEKLSYKSNSLKEIRRKELSDIFKEMLKFLENEI